MQLIDLCDSYRLEITEISWKSQKSVGNQIDLNLVRDFS